MTFTSDKEIARIYAGLINQTLPKSDWTHAAHFAAAAAMLADHTTDAFKSMPGVIRAYNLATGVENTDTDGYHHTITVASLMAAQHVLKSAPATQALFETTNDILISAYGNPKWLLRFWTEDILFSVEARRVWVGPNIQVLPFR